MSSQVAIDFARKYIGSHYLWGGGCSTPDGNDGVWYRPSAVSLVPLSTFLSRVMVGAAQCDVDGHYVCAGRYQKIAGGRLANPGDWDLGNYLAEIDKSRPNIPPFAGSFTPRVMMGKNLDDHDGLLVWGEDCRGKRHFDCISFVNWVLSWTTSTFWQASIGLYAHDASGTRDVPLSSPVVAGDILIRGKEHIGFLCENGKVIQAEGHATGVHEDEWYAPGKWSARRRLPASAFLRNAQVPGAGGVAQIVGRAR